MTVMAKRPFQRNCSSLLMLGFACGMCSSSVAPAEAASLTFTDPVLPAGADLWVITWRGNHFYTNTTGKNLTLRKIHDLAGLKDAQTKVVWTLEPG